MSIVTQNLNRSKHSFNFPLLHKQGNTSSSFIRILLTNNQNHTNSNRSPFLIPTFNYHQATTNSIISSPACTKDRSKQSISISLHCNCTKKSSSGSHVDSINTPVPVPTSTQPSSYKNYPPQRKHTSLWMLTYWAMTVLGNLPLLPPSKTGFKKK